MPLRKGPRCAGVASPFLAHCVTAGEEKTERTERELEGGKRQLINGRGGRARGERGSRRERVDRGCSDRSLRSARSLALFSVPPHVETAWGVDGVCARCRESTLKLCPHQPLRQERITQPGAAFNLTALLLPLEAKREMWQGRGQKATFQRAISTVISRAFLISGRTSLGTVVELNFDGCYRRRWCDVLPSLDHLQNACPLEVH